MVQSDGASAERTGTPAIGTGSLSLEREVRVSPSAREATTASSWNSS